MPSRRGLDILRVLKEQRITHIIAVPQLLSLMGTALDERLRAALPGPIYRAVQWLAPRLPMGLRRPLFWPVHRALGGHLRMLASGGAALPEETEALWERMGVRVLEGYGTSECSPVIACASADGSSPIGTVGLPLRGVEVRVSPENELLVRGPNVMQGYWKDPERTAEVLRDGWYATGDMASMDAAGNIRILGRVKDLIVLPSGLKVWPQDVEDVLRDHPAVKDAVVISVPGATGGASLHAYLIGRRPHPNPLPEGEGRRANPLPEGEGRSGNPPPEGEGKSGLEAIVAECNGRLAVHQRVTTASWWPEADFPRTNTMKVKRNLLPPPELGATVQVEAALAADDPVGQAIAGVGRVPSVRAEQSLAELGLDSMGLVELAIALEEKTGKRVEEEALRLDMSVAQVRTMLLQAPVAEQQGAEDRPGTWRAEPPLWPYTWGRIFRFLALPVDLLYRLTVTRTVVLGGEHLANLPPRVILAGTHHSWPDMPLVRYALSKTPARRLSGGMAVAMAAGGWGQASLWVWFGVLAFGLFPLRQFRDRDVSLRRLLQVSQAGNAILIFPQGVHARPEQEKGNPPEVRFHTGVAHLAASLEAEVLPFGLAGTERVMPADLEGFTGPVIGGGIPVSLSRGPLAIAFGPVTAPQQGETPDAFTERLQETCYALTREAEKAVEDR